MKPVDYWDQPENIAWMLNRFERWRPDWTLRREGGMWRGVHKRFGTELSATNPVDLDEQMIRFEAGT